MKSSEDPIKEEKASSETAPAERALALLKNSDLEVKVLRLPQRRNEDGTLGKQDNSSPAFGQAIRVHPHRNQTGIGKTRT